MSRKILLIGIIINFLFFSCDDFHRKKYSNGSIVIEFNEVKNSFPDTLVDHFPEKIELPAEYTYGSGGEGRNIRLQLKLQYEETEIDSIRSYFRESSVAKYDADDSCLLIVNRFLRYTEWGFRNSFKEGMERPSNCYDKYLPVPNFWKVEGEMSSINSRLSSDYVIYVFEAKQGVFSKDIDKKSRMYMPEEWINGYSKGVAINEIDGNVIYWTIIW